MKIPPKIRDSMMELCGSVIDNPPKGATGIDLTVDQGTFAVVFRVPEKRADTSMERLRAEVDESLGGGDDDAFDDD